MAKKRRHSGFSLVEVMVAVVVICIGLLGIAKMQAMSVAATNMSRQRSLAAMQAASIASAMHSNRQYWNNVLPGFQVSISGTLTAPTVVVAGDPSTVLQGQIVADVAAQGACVSSSSTATLPTCTPPQLAAYDLARWWVQSVGNQLPNPTAQVTCPGAPVGNAAPMSCTVQIQWTEKTVAINSTLAGNEEQNAGTAAAEIPTFTLYVEP
ncbi:MAG: type IV pilus modification protein PilV [Proteobacteria bacterium]|nr:type IV pilus modification protein PilV [Pseudomonadota bacterium]